MARASRPRLVWKETRAGRPRRAGERRPRLAGHTGEPVPRRLDVGLRQAVADALGEDLDVGAAALQQLRQRAACSRAARSGPSRPRRSARARRRDPAAGPARAAPSAAAARPRPACRGGAAARRRRRWRRWSNPRRTPGRGRTRTRAAAAPTKSASSCVRGFRSSTSNTPSASRRKNRGMPFSSTLPRGLSTFAPGSSVCPRPTRSFSCRRCREAPAGWAADGRRRGRSGGRSSVRVGVHGSTMWNAATSAVVQIRRHGLVARATSRSASAAAGSSSSSSRGAVRRRPAASARRRAFRPAR